jgi:hypothetical protein
LTCTAVINKLNELNVGYTHTHHTHTHTTHTNTPHTHTHTTHAHTPHTHHTRTHTPHTHTHTHTVPCIYRIAIILLYSIALPFNSKFPSLYITTMLSTSPALSTACFCHCFTTSSFIYIASCIYIILSFTLTSYITLISFS